MKFVTNLIRKISPYFTCVATLSFENNETKKIEANGAACTIKPVFQVVDNVNTRLVGRIIAKFQGAYFRDTV